MKTIQKFKNVPCVCKYIFKRGKNKGKPCGDKNCEKHLQTEIVNKNDKENVEIIEIAIDKSPKKVKINNKKPIVNIYSDDFSDLYEEDIFLEYYNKFKELKPHMTEENASVLIKLIKALETLDPSSTEYYKNKTLIDKAFKIPWGKLYSAFQQTPDIESTISHQKKKKKTVQGVKIEIEHKYIPFLNNLASELDENIYGMDSVKNELINYICKWITNPNSNRNILGLYGPAGLCKTKIVQVLSTILKYPLETIPLGGIKDSSFLVGHNYTYVESDNGKIVQSLINTQVMNPIIYFDELDKLSETSAGKEIANLLIFLTDPNQNKNFKDHYFNNLSFDLSKAFFIFTFNDINKVESVLLDRINLIKVQDLSFQEKKIVLKDYMFKEALLNINSKLNITFSDDCFDYVLSNFLNTTPDTSGLRELTFILEKCIMEINKMHLMNEFHHKEVSLDILKHIINKIKIKKDTQHAYLSMYS